MLADKSEKSLQNQGGQAMQVSLIHTQMDYVLPVQAARESCWHKLAVHYHLGSLLEFGFWRNGEFGIAKDRQNNISKRTG